MIPQQQIDEIREELQYCKRPIFFFHDDPDGLCSFLLFYRYVGAGKGVVVKSVPRLTKEIFAQKVEDYGADKVFVLDLANVDDDFIDAVKVPIVWIDHHEPVKKHKVKYFNPRLENPDEYSPVSYWCYKVVGQDLWISVIGCIGDAFYPEYMAEFRKKFPKLAGRSRDVKKMTYATKLGTLVRIFSFALKGPTKNAMKVVRVLTRIQSPYEIVEQSTGPGRFVYKQYEKILQEYTSLLSSAKKNKLKKNLFYYVYKSRISFTSDLANEISYNYPKACVLIGREKNDEVKFSIRWNKDAAEMLKSILSSVHGYGGGHKNACGAVIKKSDALKFVGLVQDYVSRKPNSTSEIKASVSAKT